MIAEESLKEGKLQESLTQLQDQVRKNPSDSKARIFLFQLLTVMGQWDRALTQLNVAGDMDDGNLAMVQAYRETIQCEVLRSEIFAGGRSPLIFGEPEQWVALVVEALKLSGQGHHGEAQKLRDRAFEDAPATSGTIDDQPFEWIADADPRLGPLLEAIVNGHYYWIPFHRIAKIHIEEPSDLRDIVWTPVHFEWANGGETVGMIPTRYPGSQDQDDDQIRLARKTDWVESAPGLYTGLGQRMLATDVDEYSIMDTRLICLNTSDEQSPDGADAGPQADAANPSEAIDG